MAATFVTKSSRAPADCPSSPASSVSPATVRGGTNEIAIATPGTVSEMSRRTSATEPTTPVARAARRSISPGLHAAGDLRVRLGHDVVHHEEPDQPADGYGGDRTSDDQTEAPQEVGAAADDHRQHRPLDRDHQRGDDHGADDRGRGVRHHPGRGDDRGEHEKDPEPAQTLTDVRAFEEHRVAHVVEVLGGDRRHRARVRPPGPRRSDPADPTIQVAVDALMGER